MNTISNLNWQQRLAVINAINPTDEQASKVFGVSVNELNTARKTITAATDFDTEPFKSHFVKPTISSKPSRTGVQSTSGTVIQRKRGRPSSKIVDALTKVSTTPTLLTTYAATHNVSSNVLRQVKRFTTDAKGDTLPQFENKTIRVGKKDGESCIWLEPTESDATA